MAVPRWGDPPDVRCRMGRAAPASAPPVVPAPALPSWPPSTAGRSFADRQQRRKLPRDRATERPLPARLPPATGRRAGARGGRHDGAPTWPAPSTAAARAPGFATVAIPANAVENSGSLTGHILAQGWADTPAERSSNARVMIVLAAALGLLVAISVMVVLLAGDALDGLVGSVLNG